MHTSLSQKQKQADSTDSSFLNDSDTPDLKTKEVADAMSPYKGANSNNLSYSFGNISVHPNRPASIQPKLIVNRPGDKYEQEADEMADKVVRMSTAKTLSPLSQFTGVSIQRKYEHEEEKIRHEENAGSEKQGHVALIPQVVKDTLQSKGRPLDKEIRTSMESRFGHDFSKVKIFNDAQATRSAQMLHAKAYTLNQNIVFDAKYYSPATNQGRFLLAHELTHTIQQSKGGSGSSPNIIGSLEQEANTAAHYAAKSGNKKINVTGKAGGGLLRKENDDDGPTVAHFGQDEVDELTKFWKDEQKKTNDPKVKKQYQNYINRLKNRSRIQEPSGTQSELEVAHLYSTIGGSGERVYKDGSQRHPQSKPGKEEEVPKPGVVEAKKRAKGVNVKDSTKPDFTNTSVHGEVKNWNILYPRSEYTANKMLDRLAQQVNDRREHGDANIKQQTVVLDMRGQKPTPEQIQAIGKTFAERTGLPVKNIQIILWDKPDSTNQGSGKQGTTSTPVPTVKKSDSNKAAGSGSKSASNTEAQMDVKVAKVKKPKATGEADHQAKPRSKTKAAALLKNPDENKIAGSGSKSASSTAVQTDAKGTKTKKPKTMGEADRQVKPRSKTKAAALLENQDENKTAGSVPKSVSNTSVKPDTKVTKIEEAKLTGEADHQTKPQPQTPSITPLKNQDGNKPALSTDSKTPVGPEKTGPGAKLPVSGKPVDPPKPSNVATPKIDTAKASQTSKPTTAAKPASSIPKANVPQSTQNKPVTTSHASVDISHGQPPASQKGGSLSTAHKQGIIGGPGEFGLQGSAGVERSRTSANGIKSGQTLNIGGKIDIKVVEAQPPSWPPKYTVTFTADLSANAGVSGGYGKEGKLGVGAGATLSGSLSYSRSHNFSEEQTKAYLASVKNDTSGASAEIILARMVAAGKIKEAQAYIKGLNNPQSSAQDARNLAEGDSSTTTIGGKAGGNVSVARGPVGFEAGISRSGELKITQSKIGGKIHVTISVIGEKGKTVGGSVSPGVANFGMSHTEGTNQSQSVDFVLDPDAPDYSAKLKNITSVNTAQDLLKVTGKYPDLTQSKTEGHGTSSNTDTKAGVLGVNLNLTDSHAYNKKVTKGPDGVTQSVEGSSGGGAELNAGDHKLLSYHQDDSFNSSVGPDNKGHGVTATTKTETDISKSAASLGHSLAEHPLGTIGGIVSGNYNVLQDKTDVGGKYVEDENYANIIELAKNPVAWEKNWSGSVNTFIAWKALRGKINAAGGDRAKIQDILAKFESEDSGRNQTINNALGGSDNLYEFPDAISAQKTVYDELVRGNPIAHARELAGVGRNAEAITELQAVNAKLDKLLYAIRSNIKEFENPAAAADLMGNITKRKTELRAEINKLTPHEAKTAAPGPIGPPTAAEANAAEEKEAESKKIAEKQEIINQINDIIDKCLGYRDRENSNFAEIKHEFDKENNIFSRPDIEVIMNRLNELKPLYEKWDVSMHELIALYAKIGYGPERASRLNPDRTQWQAFYKKGFGGY